jgi:hypothetical protein
MNFPRAASSAIASGTLLAILVWGLDSIARWNQFMAVGAGLFVMGALLVAASSANRGTQRRVPGGTKRSIRAA